MVQSNVSLNVKKGTLHGLHFQISPHEEVKLVRCTRGKIWDVMVDLRPDSPTFKQWVRRGANGREPQDALRPTALRTRLHHVDGNGRGFLSSLSPVQP